MALYQRIRDLREDSDKTQDDLAEYLETTAQYYGKYELGHAEIPFERAIMLAKYYNVSLDYIAGLTNNKRGLSSSDLTKEQQELLTLLSELSENDKKRLAQIIKLILKQ